MRTLRFLLQKEFRQIFRDKSILRVIFIMPAVQLLVLPWAADYEVKNINLAVVDNDRSDYAQKLVSKITASGYFKLDRYTASYADALHEIEKNNADIILEIPASFEKNLIKESASTLFMAVNAVNGTKAGLGASYLQTIVRNFNEDIRTKWVQAPRFNTQSQIDVTHSNWFNLHMNYKSFMVPGIIVILVTMVGSFIAAVNIVREKEIGTIEQINVTPIRKYHFILGKLIPFWVLGLVILTTGLTIAYLAYGIIPVGSIFVIYVFAAVYLLAVLGLGLLVSTFCNTQQQAMLSAFFLMMIFVMLSGLYTSITSMPVWAQWVTKFNPVTYFIEVMRSIVLKGSTFADISKNLLIVFGFAVVLNTWAVLSYRKRA
ncbi:ABC transporter permease [Parafilimonas terrae]|uniref:Transport permease protein n=1 Tax=Parafilimonas terrae TaxID=1465490 RepID=A0A1I5YWD0_9BACT|nr:ABC transporter permease [Parafilimonas terrae]SFQ48529.1 ABC-2 type transport system permease protein [Parafilimonas terrae]